MDMEREMEREGDGEGEKGRMCRWLLSQGGFFLFFQTWTSTKGVYWLMRSATIHEERESQCVIPLSSSWYNQKNILKNSLLWHCSGESRQIRAGGKIGFILGWKARGERQGDKDTVAAEIGILRCETQFFFFFEDRTLALTGDTTYTVRV